MKVTMMLADAVQAVAGKLYILGGGWSITGPEPKPSALAIKIEVPWTEANRRHKLIVTLLDADERPAMVGERAVEVAAEFEVGRPAGLPPGAPLDATIALGIGPLALQAGARYVWRLSINGETREDWQVGFIVKGKYERG